MDLKGTGCKDVDWILVNTILNLLCTASRQNGRNNWCLQGSRFLWNISILIILPGAMLRRLQWMGSHEAKMTSWL